MQGHKRTARSERPFPEGRELLGINTSLTTKRTAGVYGDNDTDGIEDARIASVGDAVPVNGASNVSFRLIDAAAAVDPQVVYRNLWLFIWLKVMGSFDSGAFSAALGAESGIGNTWKLSMKKQGILTSSVFLGNVIGCPLAGHLFSRYNEKKVLCGSLVIHTVFTFLFASMPAYNIALVNRFFIGITLSFIVVYTPVWVDEFAPRNRQSVWMASHNAGVPLGIMMGYLMAAGPQTVFAGVGWNWAFFVKCVLMVPTIAYVARVDSHTINTTKVADGNDKESGAAGGALGATVAGEEGRPSTTNTAREQATRGPYAVLSSPSALLGYCRYAVVSFYSILASLVGNVVYICSVISLTSLYFVATGLQNFVTQYLQGPPFNASITIIMIGFGSAVVTAPVCGVIAGGILLDRIGGYKRNLRRVTFFLFTWGGCAVLFSVICIFAKTTHGFLLVMSVVLFCGGALIPPGAGLTMAALPDALRSAGAAFSQTIYNLLGNFSGPLVCGWVADLTGELRYGIITLLLCSVLGVVPLFGILVVAFRNSLLPGALGGAEDAAIAGATGETVMLEEADEMDSVGGEDGKEGLHCEAAVESEGDEAAEAPQQRRQGRGGAQETKADLPATTLSRERGVGNGVVVTASVRDGPQTSSVGPAVVLSPGQPPLPTSLTPVVPVPSVPLPVSPWQPQPSQVQPQQQPLQQVSLLSGVMHTWGTGRPNLQGPGVAHPVVMLSSEVRTPTAQTIADVNAAPLADANRRFTSHEHAAERVTDLELLKLESEAAEVLSSPHEQAYGMDLVRSWLSTQQQRSAGSAGGFGALRSGSEAMTPTLTPRENSLPRNLPSNNNNVRQ